MTQPQGETSGLTVFVRPPCGWSTGFMAMPRTEGTQPSFMFNPAEPIFSFRWYILDNLPKVAKKLIVTRFSKPDGSLITKKLLHCVLYKTLQNSPAALAQGFCINLFKKILYKESPVLKYASGKKKPLERIVTNKFFEKKKRNIEPKKILSER